MSECLGHPTLGYYRTRDPLGTAGDFTTAPEVSQIFGEMLGLFLIDRWEAIGRPPRFHLVELGPGRGTLFADILRIARIRPDFLKAGHGHLIETSPALRARQQALLREHARRIAWAETLERVEDDAPLLLIANEFFDALPIRQYVKTAAGWCERLVGLDGDSFTYVLQPTRALLPHGEEGAVLETRPSDEPILRAIAARIRRHGGAALIIDYGFEGPAFGDTFQAVRGHRFADPLADPGSADLTAHVDFGHLASLARLEGARCFGPAGQGEFLTRLGLDLRVAQLTQAHPERAAEFAAARERLTAPAQMGSVFKVLCIAGEGSPLPPGFAA
ncbi:MAG: SAM-dependent methyltransferase [Alphaproteobacteria bacterium]|nr:SAM-dependent methyltransferase [Alphaproteobacteria bacterium]